MASIGVEWWIQLVQSETENDEKERENEREEFDEIFAPLSQSRIVAIFLCPHGTVLNVAGGSVPSGAGRRAVLGIGGLEWR